MGDSSGIKPFLAENLDKALIRNEWEKWLRSLKLYLASEEIVDPVKKRNKLLHIGGTQLQEVAYNLPGAVDEDDPETETDVFKTLVEKLTEYFSPIQNSTFERHVFRNLKKEEGETFSKFLLKIRQQASKCVFGSTAQESKEISIKDKLIDGWASAELKAKLLEKERSLEETIELCKIHEQARQQSQSMTSNDQGASISAVNKITWSNRRTGGNYCTRCGRHGHPPFSNQCPAKDSKCYKCGSQGHFSSCCRTRFDKRKPSSSTGEMTKRYKYNSRVHFVEAIEDEEPETNTPIKSFECFKIDEIRQHSSPEAREELVQCTVGGVPLILLIDSGCGVNIIKMQGWEKLRKQEAGVWNVDTKRNDQLKPYGAGEPLEISHRFQSTVAIPGKQVSLPTST
ncbi:uncharacterized protein LOC123318367 [Coccinella septempunctata]|uniref:uncharacterized protein LOC123318367 n=1 Tax=Coccinella septempunctata TaxID=41139 RepID=UPI001D08EED6|nr:uncharacterized protein LOC123318367 [Coccinella septempunctata]